MPCLLAVRVSAAIGHRSHLKSLTATIQYEQSMSSDTIFKCWCVIPSNCHYNIPPANSHHSYVCAPSVHVTLYKLFVVICHLLRLVVSLPLSLCSTCVYYTHATVCCMCVFCMHGMQLTICLHNKAAMPLYCTHAMCMPQCSHV